MFCGNCKTHLSDDLAFCTNCGVSTQTFTGEVETVIAPRTTVSSEFIQTKSTSSLSIFALLLGALAIGVTGTYIFLENRSSQPNVERAKVPDPPATSEPEKLVVAKNTKVLVPATPEPATPIDDINQDQSDRAENGARVAANAAANAARAAANAMVNTANSIAKPGHTEEQIRLGQIRAAEAIRADMNLAATQAAQKKHSASNFIGSGCSEIQFVQTFSSLYRTEYVGVYRCQMKGKILGFSNYDFNLRVTGSVVYQNGVLGKSFSVD